MGSALCSLTRNAHWPALRKPAAQLLLLVAALQRGGHTNGEHLRATHKPLPRPCRRHHRVAPDKLPAPLARRHRGVPRLGAGVPDPANTGLYANAYDAERGTRAGAAEP